MNKGLKNNEKIFDAVLSEALLEYAENELKELEKSPCEHTFSPEFERKITKLAKGISLREGARAVLKGALKAAMCAASIFGIVFAILLTQPKVYAAVNHVLWEKVDDNTDIISFSANGDAAEFNPYVKLGYIPEGYYLYSITYGSEDTIAWQVYKNDDFEQFRFNYFIGDGRRYIDSKLHTFDIITKDKQTYYFYEAADDSDSSSLIWYKNGYAYFLDAEFGVDELMKIAENIVFLEVVEP